MKKENFNDLYNMNLKKHIEKDYKNLSYLSWATAYKLAMDKDPALTYEVLTADDGLPFFSRGDVHIVKTRIKMFGEVKEMFLPVMDNKHNAVSKPNSRQINDSIMRCLVKNLAMFGLGLTLYTNEDLTEVQEKKEEKKVDEKKQVQFQMPTRNQIIGKLLDLPNDKMGRMLSAFKVRKVFDMSDNQLQEAYTKIFIN